MTLRTPALALAAIALFALPAPATAGKGSKVAVREFKGTVVSTAAGGKTFRLRRAGRPSVKVRLSRRTKMAKGARPRKGSNLVVNARREKKGWIARSVRLAPEKKLAGDKLTDEQLAEEQARDLAEEKQGEQDEDEDSGLESLLDDAFDGSSDEGE